MPAQKTPRLTPDQLDMIRLLEAAFDGSQTIFGIKDRQHRYLHVNEEMAQALGCPADKIIGSTPDRFVLQASAQALFQHQEDVMATGRSARYIDQIGVGMRTLTYSTVYFPFKNEQGTVTGIGFIGVHVEDRVWLNAGMQDMVEKAQETILDLQKQVDDMRLKATTDPLTGVWNRVQAEVIGRQEMSRQERSSSQVSIIFVDLDHFKAVNDTWGHAIGDAVLVEFCKVVGCCLRAVDVLARWGGEEFTIILPNTDLENAVVIADRIRLHLEAHPFEHIDSLTASFGIATYISGETWHHWIERADSALYRAKSKGRNRVELSRIAFGDETVVDRRANPSGFLRLVWRKNYESGHPGLDRQHRQLFAYANNLLSALLAGVPEDEINTLIGELISTVSKHFRDEEKIIRDAGFPDVENHVKVHARIISKAQQLSKRYHEGHLSLGELFSFLAYDVVAMHMLVDDKHFFPYVNNPLPGEKKPFPPKKAAPAGVKKATEKTTGKTARSVPKNGATKTGKPLKAGKAAPSDKAAASPKKRSSTKTAPKKKTA